MPRIRVQIASRRRTLWMVADGSGNWRASGGGYAAEGVKAYLLTATRREGGRNGEFRNTPPAELGALREAELIAACRELGVRDVRVVD